MEYQFTTQDQEGKVIAEIIYDPNKPIQVMTEDGFIAKLFINEE